MNNDSVQYASNRWEVPPNGAIEIIRTGDFLSCLDANQPFKIAFDDRPSTNFEEGINFSNPSGKSFSKVRIENPFAEPLSVQIAIGNGGIRDSRLVLSGSIDTKTEMPARFIAHEQLFVAPGANQVVLPANPSRAGFTIHNRTSGSSVWVTSDPSLQPKGIELQHDWIAQGAATAEMRIYNPTAQPVQIAVSETLH